MLNTLLKIGAHRVAYLCNPLNRNEEAFGFYIRGEKGAADAYSRDAKTQLYAGLMLIHSKLQMNNLVGIYVDVDTIDNLERPAYLQLKRDLINGYFKRVFVLDKAALLGSKKALNDLRMVYDVVGGFELFVCRDGDCVSLPFNGDRCTDASWRKDE